MESMKKNEEEPPRTESKDEDGKDKCHSCDTDNIQNKMKKVDVKTSSPTSPLARNTLMLPSEVIRSNQSKQVKAKTETMSSSGSATGKNI